LRFFNLQFDKRDSTNYCFWSVQCCESVDQVEDTAEKAEGDPDAIEKWTSRNKCWPGKSCPRGEQCVPGIQQCIPGNCLKEAVEQVKDLFDPQLKPLLNGRLDDYADGPGCPGGEEFGWCDGVCDAFRGSVFNTPTMLAEFSSKASEW
jgi:hypothetical protein